MIGIIVILGISALLLGWVQKRQLTVLGFKPTKLRVIQLIFGLLLSAGICTIYHFLKVAFADNRWVLNHEMTFPITAAGVWWTLKSVLFEELLFRGALLYLLIEKTGVKKACLISAACFGVYHWFSYGAFGNPVQMIFIFVTTGIFGWMLAFAFARTKSLYLPIALHLGWNLLNIVVFSNGPLGKQLFIPINENQPEGLISLFIFLFQVMALPLLVYLYLRKMPGIDKDSSILLNK
jgi:membrane protease YdiL (CAAX protease family)